MSRWVIRLPLSLLLVLGACGDSPRPGPVDAVSEVDSAGAADVLSVDGGADTRAADVHGDVADPDAAPVDLHARLFDPGRVLEVDLTLPAASWDGLRFETRTLFDVIGPGCLDAPPESPFTWTTADAVVDGVPVTAIGVRKKGFLGSLDTERPSLKLRFDRHVDGQTVHGRDRLTLNNGRQDPARFAACLAYATFEAAGVPAPRCSLAHVRVNGQDLGVYTHVEDVKKAFLRRHFDEPLGDLYEGTLSDLRPGWLATFERKIDDDQPEGQTLTRLMAALDAPDDALLAALSDVLDLDAFFSFWAVEILINHWDGYAGNRNNFFIYEDHPGGLAVFMPWGADAVFRPGLPDRPDLTGVHVFSSGALANRLLGVPDARARLATRLRHLLDNVWDEAALLDAVNRFEALAAPLHSPPARSDAFAAAAAMRDLVSGRRAAVEAALAALPPPAPLDDAPCLSALGTVDGALDTRWGTIARDDFFETGTSTLSLDTDAFTGTLPQGGARAGLDPELPGGARFQLIAPSALDAFLVVDVRMGLEHVLADGAVALDFADAEAWLLRFTVGPDGSEAELIGLIADGLLTFDQAATTADAPIAATFSGTLLSF